MHIDMRDRVNEAEVGDFLQEHYINRLPFIGHMMVLRPRDQGDGSFLVHDFDVWFCQYMVGIIDINCLGEDAALAMTRKKMEYLWTLNERGFKALIVIRTAGKDVFVAKITDLVDAKDKWEATDDGFILPMDLFSFVGNIDGTPY